jgi:hypothetical protein
MLIASTGNINGCEFTASGEGTANPSTGVIQFSAEFTEIPAKADPFGSLLAILILPTSMFGMEIDNAVNLLTLSGGSFEFIQHVGGDGVSARADGTLARRPSGEFLWISRAEGYVNTGEIRSVDPFDAVMIPNGPGSVKESICLPLNTRTGRHLITIFREFSLGSASELPGLQLRRMTLEPDIRASSVAVAIDTAIIPFARAYLRSR